MSDRTLTSRPVTLAHVEGLTVTFPGRATPAVDGVSLEVRAGECVALVGESGSGKSLTSRALLGLLPASARVSFDRLEVVGASAPPPRSRGWGAIRGARAGLVPQDALGGLDPLRRIEHEVGDALRLHDLASGRERRDRVVSALAAAGMPEPERRMRQRSDELSGGLRQRALVASALIADPELLVADEPTTALDAGHRGRVLADLRRRVEAGAGVLLISHDLTSVRGIADRVLVMRNGRVVEQGEPAQVLGSPGHPFTRELLAASPAGKARGIRLLEPSTADSSVTPSERSVSARSASSEPRASSRRSALASLDTGLPASRLELRNISVSFGHGAERRAVLDGASLSVGAGETVGLIGESGSGKTTLLRVALGLQAADPGATDGAGAAASTGAGSIAGDVLIDGVPRSSVDRRARRELRRRIALVPQDPLDSFPRGVTGIRLLADAMRAAGAPRAERVGRVVSLAHEVGLSADELERPAGTLSGGQRQRLAIARALARDPGLLLLDEPVSALDVTVQARVLDLLDDVQARRGTAYLLVSHDEDVIRHMSDRLLRLEAGRVVQC